MRRECSSIHLAECTRAKGGRVNFHRSRFSAAGAERRVRMVHAWYRLWKDEFCGAMYERYMLWKVSTWHACYIWVMCIFASARIGPGVRAKACSRRRKVSSRFRSRAGNRAIWRAAVKTSATSNPSNATCFHETNSAPMSVSSLSFSGASSIGKSSWGSGAGGLLWRTFTGRVYARVRQKKYIFLSRFFFFRTRRSGVGSSMGRHLAARAPGCRMPRKGSLPSKRSSNRHRAMSRSMRARSGTQGGVLLAGRIRRCRDKGVAARTAVRALRRSVSKSDSST